MKRALAAVIALQALASFVCWYRRGLFMFEVFSLGELVGMVILAALAVIFDRSSAAHERALARKR